jgi:hypothetical protein
VKFESSSAQHASIELLAEFGPLATIPVGAVPKRNVSGMLRIN